jgi:aldose 1-epimerase
MKYFCALLVAAASAAAIRQAPVPDAEGRYTLTAPGIRAQFIPYGATLTNLFVKGEHFNLCSITELTVTCRQEWH